MSAFEGKVIKCRAAVAWEPSKPLSIEEVEVAPPRDGEVRLKIVSAGICHSDWHMLAGRHSSYRFPVILGHESGGIVESIGPGVTSLKPGDKVIPLYTFQCKECKYCEHPETNYCIKIRATQLKGVMPDGSTRFTCKGKEIYHYMGCSTFSEYTVLAEISVAKISENAPLDKVCLLGCAIPTGLGAVLKVAQVKENSTIAIFGLGGIGLSAAMGARLAKAKRIIGVDINSEKFEIAKQFGCTEFVNPKDHEKPIQQVLIDISDGGVDYAIECCGNISTMRAAFEACHKGWGVAVAVGLIQAGLEVSFIPYALCEGRTWKGCSFGCYKGRDDVPKLVDSYMKKEIMVDEFINEFIPLQKINEGFDNMLQGKCIRTVIKF